MIGIDKDMITMFEEAYKQQPTNEELAAQTFFANVRASNWKSAQQVCSHVLIQTRSTYVAATCGRCEASWRTWTSIPASLQTGSYADKPS